MEYISSQIGIIVVIIDKTIGSWHYLCWNERWLLYIYMFIEPL